MSVPLEAIEEEVDQLEEDAEEIEELYTEFFERVGTYTTSGPFDSRVGPFWETPSDELEEIQRKALRKYERWYNSASTLIFEYMSDRSEDFKDHYEGFTKRLRLNEQPSSGAKEVLIAQNQNFDAQLSILRSIPSRVRIEELKVRRQVSKEVSQSELDRARYLFQEDEIRASGVVAGVALERYLLMKCENAASDIDYSYRDGTSTLAQKLYEGDEIDSTVEKHLQHLADIRADCAHANEEDPDEDDVRRLLKDVEDYVRGRKL
ncbi:hypothetical protein [Halorubrum halophilum]|uniref:hypothetical protein n=1 Tax=Halorubrum halophilum TaxID=413816 RepID=UPI0012ABDCBF|nr:hypothetical protein [Halorubrum halophilum]